MGGVSGAPREGLGGAAGGGPGRGWASEARLFKLDRILTYLGVDVGISILSKTLFGLPSKNDNN